MSLVLLDNENLGEVSLSYPHGIVRCKDGSFYISDQNHNRVIRLIPQQDGSFHVNTATGTVTSYAGYQDGPAIQARFNFIGALALDDKENLYIADGGNSKIRILSNDGIVSTFTPLIEQNGELQELKIQRSRSLTLDRNSEYLYFFDDSKRIFKIHIATRKCITQTDIDSNCRGPRGIVVDMNCNVYLSCHSHLLKLDKDLQNPTVVLKSDNLRGLFIDKNGRNLYIGTNDGIDKLDLKTNKITNVFIQNFSWITGMAFAGKGYIIICKYTKGQLDRIKVGEYLPWISFKLMWLGFMKNDPHSCPIARLPRDLITVILQYCYE